MQFKVTGIKGKKTMEVEWEDGELNGDKQAVDAVNAMAKEYEDEAVGPVGGPYTYEKHISCPLSAAILINEYFDSIVKAEGSVPMPPESPEGAII
jgi:hypothetical protein